MNPWLIELSAAAAFSGAVVSYAAVDPHAQLQRFPADGFQLLGVLADPKTRADRAPEW